MNHCADRGETAMATIKEIAQKAGVSIGTVDRVLHNRGMVSEKTKQKILDIVKELDYQPNQAAQGLAVMKKKLKIGFLMPEETGHPFFAEIARAAHDKAKELEKYGVQVVFMKFGFSKEEMAVEWRELRESLVGMDGIAMPGIGSTGMREVAARISSLDIPLVFYNLYIEEENFLAYVGCDYMKSGRLAAGLCALAGGNDARVVVYSEEYGICQTNENILLEKSLTQNRMKGFEQEVKERYPKMKILDHRRLSHDQIDNYLSACEMLKLYPDVNIVYVMNPGDYGICEAIYRADEKHQVKIITNDAAGRQSDMMQRGIIAATICQEPEKQGAVPLEILFRYLAYGEKPEERMCYTDLSIHIAQNL